METPVDMLTNVVTFLKKTVKDYRYIVGDTSQQEKATTPVVYTQDLTIKENAEDKYTPFILARITKGVDDTGSVNTAASVIHIQIIVGTTEKDKEYSSLALLNLLGHIRFELLKNKYLFWDGKTHGRLVLPLKYEVESPQPYPHGYGYIETDWEIAQPVEEDANYGF